ncbi:MAG: glycerol-3-phosphate 1-O-acyltransferase PlsY [Desulfatiglandales bacterium]
MTDHSVHALNAFWILFPVASYVLGSMPFGKLIGQKVARIDITERGSGNIGATNVTREIGIKWGIFTLVLDLLKGFIPVFLFGLFFPDFELGQAIVGLSALSGHQFSLFLRFRGGKGVATALGIYLAISPFPCLIALLFFMLTVYLWDFVSLGSMLSALAMPLLLVLFGKSNTLIMASLIMAALVCFKHKDNIQRLIRGEERGWRKKVVMREDREDGPIRRRNKNK